jgi:hypothetical protein
MGVRQVLREIPWAGRVWGLPALTSSCPPTVLGFPKPDMEKVDGLGPTEDSAPSSFTSETGIGFWRDSNYAVLELLNTACRLRDVRGITSLRLDAAIYEPAPARRQGSVGLPRCKEARLPTLKDRLVTPEQTWTELEINN